MVRTIVESDHSYICYKTNASGNTRIQQLTTEIDHLVSKAPRKAQKQTRSPKSPKKSNRKNVAHEERKAAKKALLIGIRYDDLAKKVEPLPEDCGLLSVILPNTHSDPPAMRQLLIGTESAQ